MRRLGRSSWGLATGVLFCLTFLGVIRDPATGAEQTPASVPAHIRGRQHPSYQVFAYQLRLPAITVSDTNMVVVAGRLGIQPTRVGQLSRQEIETLATLFGVPAGVLNQCFRSLANDLRLSAEVLAQDLRTTVIDYKYLVDRWNCYTPPSDMQAFKAAALKVLEEGELSKAWEMYRSLPRPEAPIVNAPGAPALPKGLRIVGF
jgi:hypothetical protein